MLLDHRNSGIIIRKHEDKIDFNLLSNHHATDINDQRKFFRNAKLEFSWDLIAVFGWSRGKKKYCISAIGRSIILWKKF